VLDETGILKYYNKEGGVLKGEILLKNVGSVRAAHANKKNCFKVVTNNREYLFSSEDPNDMKDWIDTLSNARKQLKGSETSFEAKRIGESDFEKLRVVGQGSFGKVLQVVRVCIDFKFGFFIPCVLKLKRTETQRDRTNIRHESSQQRNCHRKG